jgi:hypothetical protein
MSRLKVGAKVRIASAIPGFYMQRGTIDASTEPFVADQRSREAALQEMRLYAVRLDDGRHFRFRGRDLNLCDDSPAPRVLETVELRA